MPSKDFVFFLCMYKMDVEIKKETREKCGIRIVKHYNEKEDITELWQKVSDLETQIKHSNICDIALKRIRKYCGKKTKDITEEEKEKYKAFFEGETGIFIIEKLTRDIIERCKLPEAIELRKKLGCNHDDIMVREETSIAEKIIKLFPHENIVLNKKFNNRKPDIWFKNHNLIIEVDEGNHENYDSDDGKEREDMFKFFWGNPNGLGFDINKFLGEINFHISKLREKNVGNKGNNKAINKIAEDFEKVIAVTELK